MPNDSYGRQKPLRYGHRMCPSLRAARLFWTSVALACVADGYYPAFLRPYQKSPGSRTHASLKNAKGLDDLRVSVSQAWVSLFPIESSSTECTKNRKWRRANRYGMGAINLHPGRSAYRSVRRFK